MSSHVKGRDETPGPEELLAWFREPVTSRRWSPETAAMKVTQITGAEAHGRNIRRWFKQLDSPDLQFAISPENLEPFQDLWRAAAAAGVLDDWTRLDTSAPGSGESGSGSTYVDGLAEAAGAIEILAMGLRQKIVMLSAGHARPRRAEGGPPDPAGGKASG